MVRCFAVGVCVSQYFIRDKYREKISQYWIYRDSGFETIKNYYAKNLRNPPPTYMFFQPWLCDNLTDWGTWVHGELSTREEITITLVGVIYLIEYLFASFAKCGNHSAFVRHWASEASPTSASLTWSYSSNSFWSMGDGYLHCPTTISSVDLI